MNHREQQARMRRLQRASVRRDEPPHYEPDPVITDRRVVVHLKPGTVVPVTKDRSTTVISHSWTIEPKTRRLYVPTIDEETGEEVIRFMGVQRWVVATPSEGGPDFLPVAWRIWITTRKGQAPSFSLHHSWCKGEDKDWTTEQTRMSMGEAARWLDSHGADGQGTQVLVDLLSSDGRN